MARPRRRHRLERLVLASSALLFACASKEVSEAPLDSSAADELRKLARLRVYFGHQSVGENIVLGLEDLKQRAGVSALEIVRLDPGVPPRGPAFMHSAVGQNHAPGSKFDAFLALMDGPLAGKVDVALVKLCYVDIDKETDVDAVFARYVALVEAMKSRHPEVRLVHVTAPLMVKEGYGRFKYLIKSALGMENDNVRRNRFSQLLRDKYAGELVFDLERIESTYPDGSRESFDSGRHFGLVHGYTTDGGHLSEIGRRRVARELLRLLATVAPQPAAGAPAPEAGAAAPEAAVGSGTE